MAHYTNSAVWTLPYAYAQPNHPGSDNHVSVLLGLTFPVSCRFKESVKGGQEAIKVYWNPCNKWTQESSSLTAPNNCIDIAVSEP